MTFHRYPPQYKREQRNEKISEIASPGRVPPVSLSRHCSPKTTGLALILPLILGLTIPDQAFSGKLGNTRRAVREKSDSKKSDGSSGGNGDDSDDNDSDDDDSGLFLACLIPFITPFCLAGLIAKDKSSKTSSGTGASEESTRTYFLPYPYALDFKGHTIELKPDDTDDITFDETHDPYFLSKAAGRLTASYIYDWDTVHIPGLSFMLDTTSHIGVDTTWRIYLEPIDDRVDKIVMGDLNLTVRLFNNPYITFHLGAGGRLFTDGKVNGGFNGMARLTCFPIKPLIFGATIDLGNVGRAFLLEADFSIGASIRHLELFIGYKTTHFYGNEESVVFHGPTAGATAWF